MISSAFDIGFEDIMPYNQEADAGSILYFFDGYRKGHKKLTIVVSDTDIVLFALYLFSGLDVNEPWVEYSVCQHKRWLPIHDYAKFLGEEICRTLRFWHAITGEGTVSAFSDRGRKTAWGVWGVF